MHRDHARDNRRRPSDAEARMWLHLRDRRLIGWKFRRQHPIGPYVLDFYCAAARVAVELDGGQHTEDAARRYDVGRSAWLQERGIRVLRFWNDQALAETETVLERILEMVNQPSPQPSPRRGEGGALNDA